MKVRLEQHSRFQMTGIVTKENSSPVKSIRVRISMPAIAIQSRGFLIWQPKNQVCASDLRHLHDLRV